MATQGKCSILWEGRVYKEHSANLAVRGLHLPACPVNRFLKKGVNPCENGKRWAEPPAGLLSDGPVLR